MVSEFNEELFAVMLDKTEGEVYRKVASQEHKAMRHGLTDAGMKAYMMMYVWFIETTGLQLSERLMHLMRPVAAKHEEEITDLIEAWEREEHAVRRLDPDGEELPDAWEMTALKCMLV